MSVTRAQALWLLVFVLFPSCNRIAALVLCAGFFVLLGAEFWDLSFRPLLFSSSSSLVAPSVFDALHSNPGCSGCFTPGVQTAEEGSRTAASRHGAAPHNTTRHERTQHHTRVGAFDCAPLGDRTPPRPVKHAVLLLRRSRWVSCPVPLLLRCRSLPPLLLLDFRGSSPCVCPVPPCEGCVRPRCSLRSLCPPGAQPRVRPAAATAAQRQDTTRTTHAARQSTRQRHGDGATSGGTTTA